MLNIKNDSKKLLIEIAAIKDDKKRIELIENWYNFYVKELTWYFDSSSDKTNPFSFREMAYKMLTQKMCEELFNHPNVRITTEYQPTFGRIKVSAAVGLLKLQDPPLEISQDRNRTNGLRLPPSLIE